MSLTGIRPTRLRCEYLVEPLGIDAARPRFSWVLESLDDAARNLKQSAFRIRVASSKKVLDEGQGDLWDSGRIESDRQLHVVYDGAKLQSGQRCYWEVEVWGSGAQEHSQRAGSWFEMGLLMGNDWEGLWIGSGRQLPQSDEEFYEDDPAPLLRRSFEVSRPVRRARLYATALGYLDLRLNGVPVSDTVLDPAWTSTRHRIHYRVYDVTEGLVEGDNALAAMLGNGWRNPLPLRMWGRINIRESLPVGRPAMLCQLHIDYEDGSQKIISSDDRWRVADGPILRNSVYLGEHVDARLEPSRWQFPEFDDRDWSSASKSKDQPGLQADPVRLQAAPIPPIRVTKILEPISIIEISDGVWVFDLGQNFAGWARLRVSGPSGTKIRMRMGELLYEDGTLNPMTAVAGQVKRLRENGISVGGPGAPEVAWQENVYTLRGSAEGEGEETYTPRFTFHGFRYVEVTGFPGTPGIDAIEGLRLNTDLEAIGSFRCSNTAFNQIKDVVEWTLLSNIFGVQSDCPAREKFQYGGDIVASSEMAFFNHDMATFYAKAVDDHRDDRVGGWFTETAPFVGIQAANYAERAGPIGWGLAHPLLVTQLLQYTGNERLLEEHYPAARQWVDLLNEASDDSIIDRCIGDHESLDPKPIALIATTQFHQATSMVADMASFLGRDDEAARYIEHAMHIHSRFLEEFLAEGTGVFDSGTQAAQASALFSGLVPTTEREAAVQRMVDAVVNDHDGHIAAGIFGTKYLLRELTATGNADIAYNLVNQPDFPGWRHMMANGATTLWETWAQSDNVFSQNHPMFGSVSEWFFRSLGGINPSPNAIGFDKVWLSPYFAPELDWVETRYDSVRGPVITRWERRRKGIELMVSIPVGVTAEIHIPTGDLADAKEGGIDVRDRSDLDVLRRTNESMVLLVGSGTWTFHA